MEELKPCPFCGGRGIVEMDECWYWEYRACCSNCTVDLGHFETKEEAIAKWNRRVVQ